MPSAASSNSHKILGTFLVQVQGSNKSNNSSSKIKLTTIICKRRNPRHLRTRAASERPMRTRRI